MLKDTLKRTRSAFAYVAFFSLLINILMLTVPLYMLQIFDRVIASQGVDTLLFLTLIAVIAVLTLSLLDIVRSHILVRISQWIDEKLSPEALDKSISHTLEGGDYAAQSLADINNIRQFLSGSSIFAFFDAPWVFIYLFVIYVLSIPLGIVATIGAVILFGFAILNEMLSRKPLNSANTIQIQNQQYINDALKNAESIQAMGMLQNIISAWSTQNNDVLTEQGSASRKSSVILSIAKFIRLVLQILILGLGAYYIIQGELTAGAMIASSIIMARALAPIEQAIGAWKQFLSAKQAHARLEKYLDNTEERTHAISLEKPTGVLTVEHITYVPPGESHPVLHNIHFNLSAGESLAIIGPSGAGKSTLARLLVGVWQPTDGAVRLDNSSLQDWSTEKLGEYLGYLPQKPQLFSGTVKQNISRLSQSDDDKAITDATEFVGAHQLILHLPESYDTPVGNYHLSGGQMQRIALARAFYNHPSFVVLDEPESAMDQDGLVQLKAMLTKAKEKKLTIVVITQRPEIAKMTDKTLILKEGQMQTFGKTADVLKE